MTKEQLIDKAKKLAALKGSPNEHEAALAALKLRELLSHYRQLGVTEEDLTIESLVINLYDTGFSFGGENWIMIVLKGIEEVYAVRVLLKKKGEKIHLYCVGGESSCIIAAYTLDFLVGALLELATPFIRPDKSMPSRGYAFLEGAAVRVVHTLIAKSVIYDKQEEVAGALIVRDVDLDKAVAHLAKEEYPEDLVTAEEDSESALWRQIGYNSAGDIRPRRAIEK